MQRSAELTPSHSQESSAKRKKTIERGFSECIETVRIKGIDQNEKKADLEALYIEHILSIQMLLHDQSIFHQAGSSSS